jgi:Protein of unknown function (DUF1595)/Protein of unknown function (DUF1588)
MWQELDFVALALTRTFIQFFLNDSGQARGLRPADKEITSEAVVDELAEAYRNRVREANHPIAMKAIDEHLRWVNANLRWLEKAKIDSEPAHLDSLLGFAARAWRRPLTKAETADLLGYYRTLREKDGLSHEDAMRDSIVIVLMSPDFCYRIDLVPADNKADNKAVPPPPAAVPELPRDEAKLDLPLRDLLARYRQNPSCASCHSRFDSFRLALEGFGPVGERRAKDLSGRAVDASATFPGGATGS